MACKFIWVESCFGWKIILLIGKWATCHWLLKCDLKTNTYGIWFLYALFASNFWIFKAFTGYLWVFMILLDLFLNSCLNLLIWVSWRFSCNIWDFWIFIWAMIPNWSWIFGSADSPRVWGGQSAVHKDCPPEALQRSCQLQKFIADSPPKDRGQSACVGQYLPEAVSVGRQCENSKADGPLGYRGQSANGQKGGSWQLD